MENGEEIYNQYSNIVYKYLICLTQDDELSQDLTQETFAIALNKINSFRYQCGYAKLQRICGTII